MMTESCQFSEHNTHSYVDFLCVGEMSLSGIVHIEDIPWMMCEGSVPLRSHQLSSFHCAAKTDCLSF